MRKDKKKGSYILEDTERHIGITKEKFRAGQTLI